MTTEYSNWFIDKIVDKEAKRIAIREQFLKDNQESYLYQAVTLDGETYVVPDLDLIVHHLVDLDS